MVLQFFISRSVFETLNTARSSLSQISYLVNLLSLALLILTFLLNLSVPTFQVLLKQAYFCVTRSTQNGVSKVCLMKRSGSVQGRE